MSTYPQVPHLPVVTLTVIKNGSGWHIHDSLDDEWTQRDTHAGAVLFAEHCRDTYCELGYPVAPFEVLA